MIVCNCYLSDYLSSLMESGSIENIGIDAVIDGAQCNDKTYRAIVCHTLFEFGIISVEKYDTLIEEINRKKKE